MEEDIEHRIDILNIVQERDFNKETCEDSYIEAVLLGIKTVLNELERLQNENEALIADNLEYQRIQDIFDKRTYRKKYLEERRKEQPNLLYPDADEIYKRYYELKRENKNLKTLHINIQGMRNGKELLNKYITDSIPKQVIRDKIKELKKNTSKAQGEELLIFDSKLDILEELLEE